MDEGVTCNLATMATISAQISALQAILEHYDSLYLSRREPASFLYRSAFWVDFRALAETANLESLSLRHRIAQTPQN